MSVAFSIEEHELHLGYYRRELQNKLDRLSRAQADVERSKNDIAFLERQIAAAKKLKKKSFDAEKFLKKERPK